MRVFAVIPKEVRNLVSSTTKRLVLWHKDFRFFTPLHCVQNDRGVEGARGDRGVAALAVAVSPPP